MKLKFLLAALLATTVATPALAATPIPKIYVSNTTVNEDAGTAAITFTREGSTSKLSTFDFRTIDVTALAPGDYTATTGRLYFQKGQSTVTTTIPINNDTDVEATETFNIRATAVTNLRIGNSLGIVTIIDNDVLAPPPPPPPTPNQITVHNVTVNEDAGTATVTVTKSGENGLPSKYGYNTTDGSAVNGADYNARSGSLIFMASGQSTSTFTVPIINDLNIEGPEVFYAKITPIDNAVVVNDTATITINDDDVPPSTQTCPDGSVIPTTQECPIVTPPPPPPVAGDILSPTLEGLPPIVAYPDPSGGLTPLPYEIKTAAPDVVGAIRITGGFAGLGRFDPKVFPCDTTGKSHLHQFYGNTAVVPCSTYEQLRTNGKSTLNYGDTTVQRSAYWMPAMFDGKGNVVQPDHITVYYKRRPLTDPVISDPTNPKYQGKGVDLPNGLFYIFGYDFATNTPATRDISFGCYPPNGAPAISGRTIQEVAATGQCITGSQFVVRGEGPSCWDGKRVDSANHRDHVSYGSYGSWGYYKCPPTHPYVIPTFTLLASYYPQVGDDVNSWSLSSDAMRPDLPAGSTIHFDFWPLWEPSVLKMGERNCIDMLLSCAGGRLTPDTGLKNGGQPMYPDANGVLIKSWVNPRHLVPIPGAEANTKMVGFNY